MKSFNKKSILWDKVYRPLMTATWYNLLYPILEKSEIMSPIFEFLNSEKEFFPEEYNVFAPFDIFPTHDLKVVVLGYRPDPESDGLAYSFTNGEYDVNVMTQMFVDNIIKGARKQNQFPFMEAKYRDLNRYQATLDRLISETEMIPESDKEILEDINREYYLTETALEDERALIDMDWHWPEDKEKFRYPLNLLANQGILFLNSIPTSSFGNGKISKHEEVWAKFIEEVLKQLSNEFENILFISFEDVPNQLLDTYIDQSTHTVLSDSLDGIDLPEIINYHVLKNKGNKKTIDFEIFVNNL